MNSYAIVKLDCRFYKIKGLDINRKITDYNEAIDLDEIVEIKSTKISDITEYDYFDDSQIIIDMVLKKDNDGYYLVPDESIKHIPWCDILKTNNLKAYYIQKIGLEPTMFVCDKDNQTYDVDYRLPIKPLTSNYEPQNTNSLFKVIYAPESSVGSINNYRYIFTSAEQLISFKTEKKKLKQSDLILIHNTVTSLTEFKVPKPPIKYTLPFLVRLFIFVWRFFTRIFR